MDLGLILALLLPILVIQVALAILALRDLVRADRRVRGIPKWAWAVIIVFGELVGPFLYFTLGRENE